MSGRFFAVDRRVWARCCELGLNPAVAYLVLACGTGRDNRTTAWSVNAIENYTSIGRKRAGEAIQQLIKSGVVTKEETNSRPRYVIADAREIPGCEGHSAHLADVEQWVLEFLDGESIQSVPAKDPARGNWPTTRPREVVAGLMLKGLIEYTRKDGFKPARVLDAEQDKPDWIWLPNSIVVRAKQEVPPLERLRQRHDVDALRLFVELYHAQSLADDGGLHHRLVRQEFGRRKLAAAGHLIFYSFEPGSVVGPYQWPFARLSPEIVDAEPKNRIWDVWSSIRELGLLERVEHLVESPTEDGEIIHPCPEETGTDTETALGRAAFDFTYERGNEIIKGRMGNERILAVSDNFPNVQMVGIYRLRYRPHTRATAAWNAKEKTWQEWTASYKQNTQNGSSGIPHVQHQGSSKELNDDQRSPKKVVQNQG